VLGVGLKGKRKREKGERKRENGKWKKDLWLKLCFLAPLHFSVKLVLFRTSKIK